MKHMLAALMLILGLVGAAQAADPDAEMGRYFAIWSDNARITPDTVDRLYASRVVYYGKPMTAAQVYRDKLNFIRRWPDRRYGVVPGSVSRTCDAAQRSCRISAVLAWQKADPTSRQGSKGANTIALTLTREDGVLKIARESGVPVAQSACRGTTQGRWACSTFR